jgi:hypothetical protein
LHAGESAGSPKHLLTLTGPVADKPGKLQVELRALFSNLNMLNYRLGAFFAPALTLFKVTGEWFFDLCVWVGWCEHPNLNRHMGVLCVRTS